MKKILLIILIAKSILISSQTPSIQWAKCLGGSYEDYCFSIQPTSDGGYITTGWSNSYNGDVTGIHTNFMGPTWACHDFWVVKLNNTGTIQWEKCLGGSGSDEGYSVQQTTDGGFIVAGLSGSNDGDITNDLGGGDFWVVKLNSTGLIQWEKCLGGSSYDHAYDIKQTYDGGFIVVGRTGSYDGDVTGLHMSDDYWVVKLNSIGSIQWQKTLGGSNGDVAKSVQQTTDGGFVIAGYTFSNDGDVIGYHANSDIWVVKLNASGIIQWKKCLGGSGYDFASSVKITSDGGIIVGGNSNSTDGDATSNKGMSDSWVVKLSNSGSIQWEKALGGSQDDEISEIEQTVDGGYVAVGNSRSFDGDVSVHYGGEDLWIIKLTSLGNLQWEKTIGGVWGHEYGKSIKQTTDGGFIIGGLASSNNGDVNGLHGQYDYWVVKMSAEPLGVETLTNQSLVSVYPNPSTGKIQIVSSEKFKIRIHNVLGEEIKDFQFNDNEIDLSKEAKGVYFVELIGNKTKEVKRIVLN